MRSRAVIAAAVVVVLAAGGGAGAWYLVKTGRLGGGLNCDKVKAEIDARIAGLPAGLAASYTGFTCDAATGKLGFDEVALLDQSTPSLRLDKVSVDGIKKANVETVFSKASYAGQPPAEAKPADPLPIFSNLTAASAVLGAGPDALTITNLHVTDLAARKFAKAPPASVQEIQALGRPEIIDLARNFSFKEISFDSAKDAAAFATGAFKAGPYDGATLASLELNSAGSQTTDGPDKLTLGSLSLKGLDVGSLYDLPTEALSSENDAVRFILALSADEFVVKDLAGTDLSGPGNWIKLAGLNVSKLRKGAFERFEITGLSGHDTDEDIDFSLADLTVNGVDSGRFLASVATDPDKPDLTGLKVDSYSLTDLSAGKASGAKITLAKTEAKTTGYSNGIPAAGTLTLSKLAIPLGILDDEEDRQAIADLGYDALVFNVTSDYTADAAAKTMDLKDFSIELENGGKLSLAMALANFDLSAVARAADVMATGMPPLAALETKLASLKLVYADHSLFDRILKVAAKEMGGTPDDVKTTATQMIDMQMADVPGPTLQAALAEIKKFIVKPGTLTISLTPEKPLGYEEIGRLDDEEAIAKNFNLAVKAE